MSPHSFQVFSLTLFTVTFLVVLFILSWFFFLCLSLKWLYSIWFCPVVHLISNYTFFCGKCILSRTYLWCSLDICLLESHVKMWSLMLEMGLSGRCLGHEDWSFSEWPRAFLVMSEFFLYNFIWELIVKKSLASLPLCLFLSHHVTPWFPLSFTMNKIFLGPHQKPRRCWQHASSTAYRTICQINLFFVNNSIKCIPL